MTSYEANDHLESKHFKCQQTAGQPLIFGIKMSSMENLMVKIL